MFLRAIYKNLLRRGGIESAFVAADILNASLITAGSPTASVLELANHHDITILPLTGPAIKELQKVQPYYANAILPANTDKGQTHGAGLPSNILEP